MYSGGCSVIWRDNMLLGITSVQLRLCCNVEYLHQYGGGITLCLLGDNISTMEAIQCNVEGWYQYSDNMMLLGR